MDNDARELPLFMDVNPWSISISFFRIEKHSLKKYSFLIYKLSMNYPWYIYEYPRNTDKIVIA